MLDIDSKLNNMDLAQALQLLGLNNKESKVYLTLLSLGEASVYAVALKANLKRPTTYVIVDELVKKGVVSRVPKLRKQIYQAKPVEELFAEWENRVRLAKQKLPELLALEAKAGKKPKVYFFEGQEGLEKTLQYGLKKMADSEMVGFYATATTKTLRSFKLYKDFNDTIKSLHIKVRGVAPDDSVLHYFRKQDKVYGRHFKVIPKDQYSTTVSIEMGDGFVKIQDWDNLQALVIENELICNALKQIFELVWKNTNDS